MLSLRDKQDIITKIKRIINQRPNERNTTQDFNV